MTKPSVYLCRLGAAALMAFLPMNAFAECFVCDKIIELDRSQAECFTNHYDEIVQAVSSAPNKPYRIDLNSCEREMVGASRNIIGLPDLPSDTNIDTDTGTDEEPSEQVAANSFFILDKSGVTCLKKLLDGLKDNFEISSVFDLYEQC